MPSKFDYQNTDRENAKPAPSSVSRDNALSSRSLGTTRSIASRPTLGQQHDTGSGGKAITAQIK